MDLQQLVVIVVAEAIGKSFGNEAVIWIGIVVVIVVLKEHGNATSGMAIVASAKVWIVDGTVASVVVENAHVLANVKVPVLRIVAIGLVQVPR